MSESVKKNNTDEKIKIEESMMVVGLKAVNDDVIELELQPLFKKKTDRGFMELVLGNNVDEILNKVQKNMSQRSKVYVPRTWASDNNITMFSGMNLCLKRIIGG